MPDGRAGLSERDRRYLLQAVLNTYDNRDRAELERLATRLLAMISCETRFAKRNEKISEPDNALTAQSGL